MAKHDYTEPTLSVKTAIDTYVDEDFTEVYADIATNVVNIGINAADIVTNKGISDSGNATNAANIATNAANIASNDTDIATNAANIATNVSDIAANAALIATNISDITALETLTQETIGVNSNITELTGLTVPLSIPQGGTGQITAQAALNALTEVASSSEEEILTSYLGNAVFKPLADIADRTRVARQTILTGQDMVATPTTVETSATKTGDLRSTYHDLGLDMLTGSKGGMTLTKAKAAGASTWVQNSIFPEAHNALFTELTNVLGSSTTMAQQMLATGVQLGSNAGNLTSANLYAFQTTHEAWMPDGSYWQYNPLSGFAMCVYEGTGVAFDLLHPMGHEPMWAVVKDQDGATGWPSLRYNSKNAMFLELTNGESVDWWTEKPTDTYINIPAGAPVNVNTNNYFLFGWFGPSLADLHPDMRGMRGVTAQLVIPGGSGEVIIDTGISDIQTVIYKSTSDTSNWSIINKAAGYGNRTKLDTTDAETTQGRFTVSGSQITIADISSDFMYIIVGSTATQSSTKVKQNSGVLRKVGTGATGHRVDLGHDFVTGNNGGMMFGRKTTAANSNLIFDTIRGAGRYLITDGDGEDKANATMVEAFLSTGVQLGTNAGLNPASICQYATFGTDEKVTTGDGLVWSINRKTGFGMVKYTGDGIAGRTLQHPMGKKLRMGWFKNLDSVVDWSTYHDTLGATYFMELNQTAGAALGTARFNDTEPDDTTITLGTSSATNAVGVNYILYGWFGDDVIPGADAGVTGEPGKSAFYHYVGGSGAVTIDTGLDDVAVVLFKTSSIAGDWFWKNMKTGTAYKLNDTAVETDLSSSYTVSGSTFTAPTNANDIEYIFFSSAALSGIDDQVIQPADPTDPLIASLASGFNISGNVDIIKKLETDTALTVTGEVGRKFIYIDQDGVLRFTSKRPVYTRNSFLSDVGWVFDINKMQMFNRELGPELVDKIEPDALTDIDANNVATYDAITGTARILSEGDFVAIGWNGRLTIGASYEATYTEIDKVAGTVRLSDGFPGVKIFDAGTETVRFIADSVNTSVARSTGNTDVTFSLSIKEVLPANPEQTTEPAVFIGECELDADGNVFNIKSYARGNFWESDWFAGVVSSTFIEENQFGHLEQDIKLVGQDTTTGELVDVTETLISSEDQCTVTFDSSLATDNYKVIGRRNF